MEGALQMRRRRATQEAWRLFLFRATAFLTRKQGAGAARAMRIIGIDPGLRNMGWGIVAADNARLRHIGNGVCVSEGRTLAHRLRSLHEQLTEVFNHYSPDAAAVEQTFVNRDGAATLKLGQARGIALLVPAQFGLEVGEYAPNKVKKSVVGVGHADKNQIAHMVRLLLPGVMLGGSDAADALAVAICHAHHSAAVLGTGDREGVGA